MLLIIYLLAGVVLGLGLAHFAERSRRDIRHTLGPALLVAAGIYVAFAMASMETKWLLVELGGFGLFGLFVYLSSRVHVGWLGVGWLLRVVWDVGLHAATNVAFVPAWYPILCVAFDVVIAVYIGRVVITNSRKRQPEVLR